ncbi:MAG TPA: S8 family serine peptidase [Candidatus Tumulicola sp.]|nr:S8 family serine peptidase [Candidatus Tumulicola sp.]
MKLRNLAPRLKALSIIAALALAACSGGGGGTGGGGGPTPTPTPAGIAGCNSGASSITAGVPDTPFVRPVNRGQQQPSMPLARVSVKYSGTGQEPAVTAALGRIGGKQSAPVNPQGWAVIDLPQGRDAASAAAALRGTPGIVDAAPVVPRYLQTTIPNDPGFGTASQMLTGPQTTHVQQDMWITNMPAAWDITTGSSSVIIAMIDTGYDANNADLCAKVVNSAVFDLGTGVQDLLATAQDNDGHGTNVSSIAAGSTNNALRWAGVGWNVSLMEIRIFPHPTSGTPNPTASSADSAAAINYAVAHGAKVISMSYGSASSDPTESAAAAAAITAGVILVGASGNGSANIVDFPAAYTGVIAVGASAIDDTTTPSSPTEYVASYSNFGSRLDVVAPGGDPTLAQQSCGVSPACDYLQWVINNYSTTAFSGTGFHSAFFAGTSQATPHVAGLAALMASKTPGISPNTARITIRTWAHNIGDAHQGQGRIDALATLNHT